jgi:ethanolamine transporter
MVDDDGENYFFMILLVVAEVASVLTGTIPMMHFLTALVGPALYRACARIGLTHVDAGGLVATIATSVPMFGMFDDMSKKGMIFATAFEVGAGYTFGDHLAYVGSIEPDMLFPMIVAKLVAGAVALAIAAVAGDSFVRKGLEALAAVKAADAARVKRRPSTSDAGHEPAVGSEESFDDDGGLQPI